MRGDAELRQAVGETVERLRADREHGASWLSREAAGLLVRLTADMPAERAVARLTFVLDAARTLAGLRPSMAALANTVARIWTAGSTQAGSETQPEVVERLQRIHSEAQRLIAAWETAPERIAAAAGPLLGPEVYTLSRSGTVEAVLARLALGGEHHVRRVIVAESRPGGEGVAAARALAEAGLTVTLVPDAAVGTFVGEVSAVVLGADSVRADGAVVNKVGSYPLALVAHEAGVPVYVLAETLKIAAPDFPLVLEQLEWPEMAQPVPGVALRSVGFELVPARLVTTVVTETGVLDRAQIAQRAREAGAALAALLGTADG